LAHNARICAADGVRVFIPSVLQADAWGHGRSLVQEVLEAEGFTALKESDGSTRPRDGDRPAGAGTVEPHTLYGLPGGAQGATPVMRMTGTVLSTKELRAGEGVSYGYAYRAPRQTRVALVTGGYAQGVVRALGGAVDVAVSGLRHPIVGRVAMDVCVVEIGDAAVHRGDDVLFLGSAALGEPSLADWMRATALRAGELITTVGLRASRVEVP
jgi:alanine racemase